MNRRLLASLLLLLVCGCCGPLPAPLSHSTAPRASATPAPTPSTSKEDIAPEAATGLRAVQAELPFSVRRKAGREKVVPALAQAVAAVLEDWFPRRAGAELKSLRRQESP